MRYLGEIAAEIRAIRCRLREAKKRRECAAAEQRDLKGRLGALVKEMLAAHARDERATRAVVALIASVMVVKPDGFQPAPLQKGEATEAGASTEKMDPKKQA